MKPEEQPFPEPHNTSSPPGQSQVTVITNVSEPDEKEYAARRREGLFGLIGCSAIVITVIAVLIFAPVAVVGGVINGLRGLFNVSSLPLTASVIDTPSIINSVLPLGQLVTVNVQLAQADISVNMHGGGVANNCYSSAMHVAVGAVEAGVDLSQLDDTAARYDEATETYYLALPTPRLTSCRIEYIRQYDRSSTALCGGAVDWDEARLLANYNALEDFRNTAVEGGIIQRAEREARVVMESFVRALTQKKVVVSFSNADDQGAAVPPSCIPQIPQGWEYSEQDQTWQKVS